MALSRVLCPTLVGRDSELSQLEDALLAALRGDGGVVIVGGEAGMGKTRLVRTLANRAERLGVEVLSGACSEAEISLPYLPFLEAAGNHLAVTDIAALRDRLGPAADELAQLFPQLGRANPQPGDPTQAKMRLFESILLLLRDAARLKALLLIVEDLQWADPATRELLDYASRRLRATNVLILATYRSDELHRKHALLPTIQGWRRSGVVEIIELRPLDANGVAEMVRAIFEEADLTEEFRDFLLERSEGNPFVLEEILRDAFDRGDIFRTARGWDRKALSEMRIPRTVTDAILHRLERLTRERVDVLSAASVVGRTFDLPTLAAVTGHDESAVLAAVETAITYQLVDEDERSTSRFRFRHALTREAIYEDMIMSRRQQLHSRVADVLMARADAEPVDLAHHLLLAARYEEAITRCVDAASAAMTRHAYRDAAELYSRAAPHVRDPLERARMLCAAGDAYWNNTEPAAARPLLEAGIAELEAAGQPVEAAAHRLTLGRCYWELLHSDLAREQFERARDVLEQHGPSEALAVAYLRLSGLVTFNRATPESLEDARRGADIAEKAGARRALAWAWNFMSIAEVALGQVELGLKHMEDSYRAAIDGGFRFQAQNAVFNGLWLSVHLGDGRRLRAWFDRAREPEWSRPSEVWAPYAIGLATLHFGRVREAIELARIALQRARDAGHEKQAWRASVLLAEALAENLQPVAAAAELPPLSSRVEGQDVVYDSASRIRTKLSAADATGAAQVAMTVAPEAANLGSPADVIAEAARPELDWLRTFVGSLPCQGECLETPRVAATEGCLALYEGRHAEARDKLGRAVEAYESGGLLLDAWHASRFLAEAEVGCGDREQAAARLQATAASADGFGARLAAHLARDTASRLGLDVADALPSGPEVDAQPVAAGERLVTVLFVDVRGYTEMSNRTAPSEMVERITSLQRWAAQEVGRRKGLVDKFAGDAIMATFNVSGQTVDHALQGLRAAIAIIDKASLAGLPVGAGIAVGPAVVGNLTEAANLSVLGTVTNLASRLQAQSEAGQVTLDAEAYRRVEPWLDGQRMGVERVELELKGFAGRVTAYRVQAGLEVPARVASRPA